MDWAMWLCLAAAPAQDRKTMDEAAAKAIDLVVERIKTTRSPVPYVRNAFLGLAILAEGSTPKSGKYADALKEAVGFFMTDIGGSEQQNWFNALGVILLAETCKKDPTDSLKVRIEALVKRLEETQEPTGGWSHSKGWKYNLPGKQVPDLAIVTGLVLLALGEAKSCKCEVSKPVLDRAFAYCAKQDDGKGGLLYGTNHPVPDIGNSRGSLMMVGQYFLGQKNEACAKAASGVAARIAELEQGHAFAAMHFFCSAVGCYVSGQFDAFKTRWINTLLNNREKDGSLWFRTTDSANYEKDQAKNNTIGTAILALILQLERGNVFKPDGSDAKAKKNPFSHK